jgi:hypothetical protein
MEEIDEDGSGEVRGPARARHLGPPPLRKRPMAIPGQPCSSPVELASNQAARAMPGGI